VPQVQFPQQLEHKLPNLELPQFLQDQQELFFWLAADVGASLPVRPSLDLLEVSWGLSFDYS
jgi:hypothetical protein